MPSGPGRALFSCHVCGESVVGKDRFWVEDLTFCCHGCLKKYKTDDEARKKALEKGSVVYNKSFSGGGGALAF